jgi:hypothetical protein
LSRQWGFQQAAGGCVVFCGRHGCGDAFAGERLVGVDAKLDLADQSSAFNRACYAGSA